MVNGVSSVGPTVLPNLFRPRGVSGRMAVPVRPLDSMYARFSHIVGVPVRADSGTVSVMRAKVLDSMLERIGGGIRISEGSTVPKDGGYSSIRAYTHQMTISTLSSLLEAGSTVNLLA